MANDSIISKTDMSGMIPEEITKEIIQGVVSDSAVLRLGRRLPNMTSRTQVMNVLDMLPMAYWVDGDSGFKQSSKVAWDKKKIYAEELAVIVPIPEAVLNDSSYDIWAEVMPRIVEAFGRKIDEAILFGANKPASWRDDIMTTAIAAGTVVIEGDDVYDDIMGEDGLIAKVEQCGYLPNAAMSAVRMRAKLRGLLDLNGQPIFKTDMQGGTQYALDGIPMYFPMNGGFDAKKAGIIAGDFSQLVYSVRQDITFKLLDQATIVDPDSKEVVYSLAQQDMLALRAVMRLGWEIPNPVNAMQSDKEQRCPFAVYAPAAGKVSTVTVSPAAPTVNKGAKQKFTAALEGEGVFYKDVNWAVSGASDVASGTGISGDGTLSIAAEETNPTLTVKATSVQTSSVSGTATVTVGE